MSRLAWIVALAACGHSATAPDKAPTPAGATGGATPGTAASGGSATGAPATGVPQAFDGIAIGAAFAPVQARAPYDKACDNDPLEHERTVRAMIYAGGRACHHAQFPDGTSVVILVEIATDKIVAFGWMGGTYFDTRSGLPVKLGESIDSAIKAWGKPVAKFDLTAMHVARFGNGLRVMSGNLDQVVGFAVGELPDDPSSERWKELDHMYAAYTTPVGSAAISVEDCRKVSEHLYALNGAANTKVADSDIADCRSHNTPAVNACILAAKTSDAVGACYRH